MVWHDFDPKDTWRKRREQSMVARGRAKPPEPAPRRERVYAGRTGTGRWSAYTFVPSAWDRVWFDDVVSGFKPLPVPAPPSSKFHPGDLVEIANPKPSYPSLFNDWNDNTLVVERVSESWGVHFVGETVYSHQDNLRLKDGPW